MPRRRGGKKLSCSQFTPHPHLARKNCEKPTPTNTAGSVLSSHALAALAEFNAEKDAHEERFEKLKAQAEANAAGGGGPLSMEAFTEDWNESQFWV